MDENEILDDLNSKKEGLSNSVFLFPLGLFLSIFFIYFIRNWYLLGFEHNKAALYLDFAAFGSIFLSLIGCIKGIRQIKRNKRLALTGAILNGIILFGHLIFFFYAMTTEYSIYSIMAKY
jgi:hypothetical protein